MPDPDHPTRTALLDAALELFDRMPAGSSSIDDVVKVAGVAKGTFYNHFHDRTEFLAALHDRFHDGLRAEIAAATVGSAPGAARLRASTVAYLDGCLGRRGVKAMLADLRGEPVIAEKVVASNARFANACTADLAAAGHRLAGPTAQLYVAAVAEIALLELRSGRDDALRDALWELFGLTAL